MALDDMIASNPEGRGRGRGRGRGGGRGGSRGRGRGGSKGRGGLRGGGKRRFARPAPVYEDYDDSYDTGYSGGGYTSRAGGAMGGFKIRISNLHFNVVDEDIQDLFGEIGQIRKANVIYDQSGRSTGEAEVTFDSRGDATRAIQKYNGIPLDGYVMRIQMDNAGYGGGGGGGGGIVARRSAGLGIVGGGIRKAPLGGGGGRGGTKGRGRGGGKGKREKTETSADDLDKDLMDYKEKKAA